MDITVSSIVAAVRRLPVGDQFDIAAQLLDANRPDDGLFDIDDPKLLEELDRRSADNEPGIPWEELRNEHKPSKGS